MNRFSSVASMTAAVFAAILFCYDGGFNYTKLASAQQKDGLPALAEQVDDLYYRVISLSDDNRELKGEVNTLTRLVNRLTNVVTDLAGDVNTLNQTVAELERVNNALKAKLAAITDDGRTLKITGRNVQIVSGSGATNDAGSLTGLGNLIIGYNENTTSSVRTGSHNVVVGTDHDYTSYGGLVAGFNNTISNAHATVSGGQNNTASAQSASVSGGSGNIAAGVADSVSGGQFCLRSGAAGVSSWGIGGATDSGPARSENCSVANDNT